MHHMARNGLLAAACAGALLAAGPLASLSADDRDLAVDATLAVQAAMRQAQDALLHNNAKAAVEVLEAQLPRINGNQNYLALLRGAYRTYIKELHLSNQEAAAGVYVRRLAILEPASAAEAGPAARPVSTIQKVKDLVRGKSDDASTRKAASATPDSSPPPKPTVRGKSADPFQDFREECRSSAQDLVDRAEKEFAGKRYAEAGGLFEQAYHADQHSTDASRERWAYCKLHRVVEQLNRPAADVAYPELEAEVRLALAMAPRIDFGKSLLREIEGRRGGVTADSAAPVNLAVRHLDRRPDGWAVAESTNFRVLHNQPREVAERAARAAEQTRAAMQRKWFGANGPDWSPKCELFLHATASDYNRVTGAPGGSPGHSSFNVQGGRVLSRQIHLHCDDPNLLVAVLPHETTHTVLAGNFGDKPVPRWADEGMAVLTEPREKVELHLRNLPRHRQDRQLFAVQQLMEMNEYPEPRYVGAFYAQSVSLVNYLTKQKSPQVFSQFIRDGLRGGYEAALQRHYGYQSFADLEQRWVQETFGDDPGRYAQAGQ
jgi:hypothetical protein